MRGIGDFAPNRLDRRNALEIYFPVRNRSYIPDEASFMVFSNDATTQRSAPKWRFVWNHNEVVVKEVTVFLTEKIETPLMHTNK